MEKHPAIHSRVNHYHYIDVNTPLAKIRKRIFHWTHCHEEYYHYTIDYFLQEAIKDIRKKQYDVILLENRPGFALKLRNVTKAKLVYHLHNEKLSCQVPQAHEIYNAAYRIITVSDYIKGVVQTINGNDNKTITIHNGIDLNAFSFDVKPASRSCMGFSNEDFILVFSGRVNQEKGVIELIEAMNRLSGYPNIKLLIIGSSFFGNEINEDVFIKQLRIKAEPMKNRVIFTGFIPYAQMPNYLKMADVAVIPSVWDDPFPTTVLEAQSMGLPIITTRRGGIPEEVTEENAFLLSTDKHFVDNLASVILDLYEHPEKRKMMSEASLKRSKLFDKETYARNFFAALEQKPTP